MNLSVAQVVALITPFDEVLVSLVGFVVATGLTRFVISLFGRVNDV